MEGMMGNKNAEGTQATIEELAKKIQELTKENARLRESGKEVDSQSASTSASSKAADTALPIAQPVTAKATLDGFLKKFQRGDRESMLANVKFNGFSAKAINAKLEG